MKEKAKKVREQEKVTPDFKLCRECNILKLPDDFNKTNSNHTGLSYKCKVCTSEHSKQWYDNNREFSLQKCKIRREELKKLDIESLRASDKQKRDKSKQYFKTYSKTYFKNRRLEDSLFKLVGNLRTRIKTSFLRVSHNKTSNTRDIIGREWEEFKQHIESQFLNWMNWENYGNCENAGYNCSWHLDHIIPASYAETEEEVYLLNHWSNFQPLCSFRNIIKNKYMGDVTNLELKIEFNGSTIKYFGENKK